MCYIITNTTSYSVSASVTHLAFCLHENYLQNCLQITDNNTNWSEVRSRYNVDQTSSDIRVVWNSAHPVVLQDWNLKIQEMFPNWEISTSNGPDSNSPPHWTERRSSQLTPPTSHPLLSWVMPVIPLLPVWFIKLLTVRANRTHRSSCHLQLELRSLVHLAVLLINKGRLFYFL